MKIGEDFSTVFCISVVAMLIGLLVTSFFGKTKDEEGGRSQGEMPSEYFKYVDFDGHQYVMYACDNRAGITHSPKCKCLKKNEETGNAQEGR